MKILYSGNYSLLPTSGDVIKCNISRKLKITNDYSGKNPSLSRIRNQLVSDIAAVYHWASVLTVSVQRIVKQLQIYNDE